METNFQINQMRKKETGKKMSLINEKKTHEFFPRDIIIFTTFKRL